MYMESRWEHRVTNAEIAQRTGINTINNEFSKRCLKWLGHMFRMQKKKHPYVTLKWNLSDKGEWENPEKSEKMIEKETAEVGKAWNELRWHALDRFEWWKLVSAYASQRAERQERRS
ncbi:hypothetical protein BsWGS_15053 [Bradybaena similaris]